MKSLKERVAELEVSRPRDHDPEQVEALLQDDERLSSNEEDAGEFDGREHYEEVGKSILRKPAQAILGKQYGGAVVSRNTLDRSTDEDPFAPVEDEDDSDPFTKEDESEIHPGESLNGDEVLEDDAEIEEDEEIDSDEAFGEGDEEKFKGFKFLGSGARGINAHVEDSEDVSEDQAEEEDMRSLPDDVSDLPSEEGLDISMENVDSDVDNDIEDESESDASTSAKEKSTKLEESSDREKLKALLSNDAAAVASSLSTAASEDAKKGKAVKQQYQTFDRLLDLRIKLQKGVAASNDLATASISNNEAITAVRKAEEAALTLWSTIESLRLSIQDSSQVSKEPPSKKRKAPPAPTPTTSMADLWARTQSLEAAALPHRRSILNKWSSKTRTATGAAPQSQLLNASQQVSQNQITAVLDSYLATESEKQVAAASVSSKSRTGTASSGAPTYDDTPFYQSLLRDLIASRSTVNLDAALPALPSKLHPSGSSHKRNVVDTKASKGRKVRYTVHEKLQNFAAPEDRTIWTDSARAEFFGSLFGGQVGARGLDERDDDDDGEGEALRLFRG